MGRDDDSSRVLHLFRMTTDSQARRIESVDLLRGLVMILMALDHTRDFFGMPGANPVDMATTTAPLFLTRWITHICAPTFFLLTGVSAGLTRTRRSASDVARYLVARGALLIVLELTLIRGFAYQFNFDYRVTLLIVIWALGWAMIFLGCLVFLPTPVIAVIGGVIVAGHNLLDSVRPTNALLAILHGPGFVLNTPAHTVFAAYPLVPWVGVTALGYVLASVYQWPAERRRRMLVMLGAGAIVAFVALRFVNGYGDPAPWKPQSASLMTVLSFFNATKYPPSLLFLLMTLGPSLLILRAVDGGTPQAMRRVLNYGRVPFFYFCAHFALIHLFAVLVAGVRYGAVHWMFESPSLDKYPFTPPPGWGFSLPMVYAIWIGVVVALYPACRKFAALKASRAYPWLTYF